MGSQYSKARARMETRDIGKDPWDVDVCTIPEDETHLVMVDKNPNDLVQPVN